MGRIEAADSGLARALFSQAQLRVLGLLFGNPNRQFTASEIIRLAQSGSGAVQRELAKLSKAGILSVTESGNRKLYQANRKGPIFRELHGLVTKTVGLTEPLRTALAAYAPRIAVAFVYGSVAKGSDKAGSDIDVMIIGDDLSYGDIYAGLHKAEKTLGRTVNPNIMSPVDWRRRRIRQTPFIERVVRQPKVFLFGSEDELERIGEPRQHGRAETTAA
jgi:predicted nucleotidyltransferase